jgi:hypothetical protein
MGALTQEATSIFEKLDENDQHFAISFLSRLKKSADIEKHERNAEYLAKIQRSIEQIAEGRGVVRDIVEVSDDD